MLNPGTMFAEPESSYWLEETGLISAPEDSPRGKPHRAQPPLESVDRALRLLLFIRQEGSVSVKEAATYLAVTTSTAHRLLSSLVFRGFAIQDFERHYRLGSVLSGKPYLQQLDKEFQDVGHQALLELHSEIQNAVRLSTLRGGSIRFLSGAGDRDLVHLGISPDSEVPAFVSAGGKAMLARFPNQEIENIYSAGIPDWPTRKVESRQMLKRVMTDVRRKGYGVSVDEYWEGIVAIGVSINVPDGTPAGAVSTAIRTEQFRHRLITPFVKALSDTARKIEHQLFASHANDPS